MILAAFAIGIIKFFQGGFAACRADGERVFALLPAL